MRNKRMLITLIVLLVVGFASVSTTLIITGVVGVASRESDFKIIFTSAKLNNKKRNDFISEDKKKINFETDKLTTVDEEAYLDYEVTNTSRLYDGEVVISCIVPENDYVIVDYQPRSMTVNAGETESGRITSRLLKASAEDGSISIECTLNATATERESLGDEYVEPFSKAGTLKKSAIQYRNRENITKIVFESELNPYEIDDTLIVDATDENSLSPVMAYYVPNQDDSSKYTLHIQSDTGVIAPQDCSRMFDFFESLKEIEGLENFDTSEVTNMQYMFSYCSSLEYIDLTDFNTRNVTNMQDMFTYCTSLRTLNINNFDTTNLKEMNYMFRGCSNLLEIDLSNFIAPNLISTQSLFRDCTKLEKVNLKNLNPTAIKYVHEMFSECNNLTEVDIRSMRLDIGSVSSSGLMFNHVPTNIKVTVNSQGVVDWLLNPINGSSSSLNVDNIIIA